ncbi:YybH family protein [Cupriavidus sp. 2MCAB6]|uniref:YybH family protein n=1 Tax=Cupriavidus sp. 2MCAB6 TaxID=3232981 RepID=UPI003F90EE67
MVHASPPASHPGSEVEVRALVDAWVNAVRAKDAVAMMRNYAEDVIIFDVVPPAQSRGVAPYRQRWQQWFDSLDGPVGFEMTGMHLTASEDLACCYSVSRVSSPPGAALPRKRGCAPLSVFARSAVNGWSCMSTHRCRSVSTPQRESAKKETRC